jgi:hypothetical protein
MKITDHVTPQDVEELFESMIDNLSKQHEAENKLAVAKLHLENLKASIFASPGFVPEKNLTIQEGKFREMYPQAYADIEAIESELKDYKDTAEKLLKTKQEYDMLIALFSVADKTIA